MSGNKTTSLTFVSLCWRWLDPETATLSRACAVTRSCRVARVPRCNRHTFPRNISCAERQFQHKQGTSCALDSLHAVFVLEKRVHVLEWDKSTHHYCVLHLEVVTSSIIIMSTFNIAFSIILCIIAIGHKLQGSLPVLKH